MLLYRTLFPSPAQELLDSALKWVDGTSGRLLRLRLSFEGSNLVELPWEYLSHPATTSRAAFFLATSHGVILSLVRPSPELPVRPPGEQLRALLIVSAPRDLAELPVDKLLGAIQRTAQDYDILILVETGATVQHLRRALKEYRPDIVHFMAHARLDETGTTAIALSTEDDLVCWVRERELADLLDARPRLVILDAPDRSNLAARLIREGIENVIEPRMGTAADVAVTFHRTLYAQIGVGDDVPTAVRRARVAAAAEASLKPDAGVPAAALYTSSHESVALVKRRAEPRRVGPPAMLKRRE